MISVVIPSFNRRDGMLRLLSDLRAQRDVDFEIVVADDASTDGSPDAIAAAFPEVRLLRTDRNGGPCVARNRAIRASTGDLIVGFDSDVSIADPFLLAKTCATFEANPQAAGLAFRLLQPDGESEDHERWWHALPLELGATRFFETDYFSGTGYAFRREPLFDAGLFPEILYMHYEEVVLALRVLDQGGRLFHAPELKILHHAAPTNRRNRIRTYYKPRSQVLMALLCYPAGRAAAYLAPRLAHQLLASLRGAHLPQFAAALASAGRLARPALNLRQPVRAETWKRIAALHRPIASR